MIQKLEHIDCEITKACNMFCIHCSAEAGQGNSPDVKFIRKSLADASILGLKRVGITGGEPFMFPQELSDIIDVSYGIRCPVHIHTNGSLLWENFSLLSERRKKIENLTLTLLGHEESHDKNCGLDGAYQNLKNVLMPLMNLGIPLTFFLIPMSNNYLGMPEAVKEFYKLGARRFRVMNLSPGGRARSKYEELKLDYKQAREFISEIESLRDELGVNFKAGHCTRLAYPMLLPLEKHVDCMSGVNRLHINADGYVFPCTASSGFIELSLGNLYEQSLEEIWINSEKLNKFRELPKESCRVQKHYRKSILGKNKL